MNDPLMAAPAGKPLAGQEGIRSSASVIIEKGLPLPIPAAISEVIDAFARRQRSLRLLRAGGEAVLVGSGALVVVAIIDLVFHPHFATRCGLSAGVWLSGLATFAWRGMVPWFRRRDPVETARAIEAAVGGELEERLSSALELAARPPVGTSGWMIGRTIALAAQEAAELDAAALVPSSRTRRMVGFAGSALLMLGAAGLVPSLRDLLVRAVWPLTTTVRPSQHALAVKPGNIAVPQGGRFALAAQVKPDAANAFADLIWEDGVVERLEIPRAAAGAFELVLPAVTQGFRYRVTAGDAESLTYRVQVSPPPLLSGLSLRIQPPGYTGLPIRSESSGDAEIVAGSSVTIEAAFSGQRVASAALLRDGRDELALHLDASGLTGTVELRPETTMSYGLRLISADGLVAEPPQHWLLSVRPDAQPSVTVAGRGLESGMVGPDEDLAISVMGQDDLGLRRLDLVVVDDVGELLRRPLLPSGGGVGPRSIARSEVIELGELRPSVGDRIIIRIEAEDLGGQQKSSDPLSLKIVDVDSARAAAWAMQLRSQLGLLDHQLESLRQAEKAWTMLVRNYRQEDPTAQRGEFMLLSSRVGQAVEQVSTVAESLRSRAFEHRREAVQNVAEQLSAWADIQRAAFAQHASVDVEADDLIRARDMTEHAHGSLSLLRQRVGLLTALIDAEVLVGTCESAGIRIKRAIPLIRGDSAWKGPAFQQGLMMSLYVGIDLLGSPAVTRVAGVDANAGGLIGREENWSARWSGEILAPVAGVYEFACQSDDGVRLKINGQHLLENAWITQAATTHKARVPLDQGWHSIEIDYFQATGGSVLTCRYGALGQPLMPLDQSNTRCPYSQYDERELIDAMARVSPAALSRARQRMADSFADGAGVPGTLSRMADDAGLEQLVKLANEARVPAGVCAELAGASSSIGSAQVDAGDRSMEALLILAQRALKNLEQVVGRNDDEAVGFFASERALLAELRSRMGEIRNVPGNLADSDRAAAVRRERTAALEAVRSLGRQLAMRSDQLLESSAAPNATLEERVEAMLSRELLIREALPIQRDLSESIRVGAEGSVIASRLERGIQAIENVLNDGERRLLSGERAAIRAEMDHQHHRLEIARQAESAGDMARADAERQQVERQIAAVVERMRRFGAWKEAMHVESALAGGRLEEAVRSIEQEIGNAQDVSKLADAAARQMAKAASAGSDAEVRDELTAAARSLALESERLSLDGSVSDRRAAPALRMLADRAVEQLHRDRPDPVVLVEMAKQLQQLRSSNTAQESEMMTSDDPLHRAAQAMERALRNRLGRGREDAIGLLAALAGDAGEAVAVDVPQPPRMERLEDLSAQDAELRERELAARASFAKMQAEIAQATDAAAQIVRSLPSANAPPGMSAIAVQMADDLSKGAVAARTRAEKSTAAPDPEAAPDDAASTANLAAQARLAAANIEQRMIRPLVTAARSQQGPSDQAAYADISARLVDIAAAQQRSAQRLEQVLSRREAIRTALANALADTTADSKPIPPALLAAWGDAVSARTAAEKQIEEARRIADPLQKSAALVPALAAAKKARELEERVLSDSSGGSLAMQSRAAAALAQAAQSSRTLAGDISSGDGEERSLASIEALAAHQSLDAATSRLAELAQGVVRTKRDQPPAIREIADPIQNAAAKALAVIRESPDSQSSWRYATELLARVSVSRALGGTVTGGQSVSVQEMAPGESAAESGRAASLPTTDRSGWGRSRGDMGNDLRTGGSESFSEEHQEAIRAYFQRVGSGR